MSKDDLELRPYNPEEDIDYDKERVFTTEHGARVVVPLEGIIKWQKRHYQREIGNLKTRIKELEDQCKALSLQCRKHEDKIEGLKEENSALRADIKQSPVYKERVVALQKQNSRLKKINVHLRNANSALVVTLRMHGLEAVIYSEPEMDEIDQTS